MDLFNQLVFAGALLLLLAILASALSYRIGMPLLLVFLAVGMLAGEDGPGGIVFNHSGFAYMAGSVALAVILLDGGLNTRAESFRGSLRPAATCSASTATPCVRSPSACVRAPSMRWSARAGCWHRIPRCGVRPNRAMCIR